MVQPVKPSSGASLSLKNLWRGGAFEISVSVRFPGLENYDYDSPERDQTIFHCVARMMKECRLRKRRSRYPV